MNSATRFKMAPVKSVCLKTLIKKGEQPLAEHFELRESEESPTLKDGQVLVKTLYLSVDPILRYKMSQGTFLSPWAVGEPCIGVGVGVVLESKIQGIAVHDIVESRDFPWKTQFTIEGKALNKVLK